MSILYWVVMLIACFSLDFHTFILSIQATVIRHSSVTDAEKGKKLADLVKHGMKAKQVKLIFGTTRPLILSTGPILEGQYWYSKYHSIIYFDANGRVIAVEHKSENPVK